MIIVDTNVIIYQIIPSEHSAAARLAFEYEGDLLAPSSWRVEFLNVLTKNVRAKRITVDEALAAYTSALRLVRDYPFDIDPRRVIELSLQSGVSGYDCIFVVAALRNSLPLVTFDKGLLKAFPEIAILPAKIESWFARRDEKQT